MLTPASIIQKKRDGKELSSEEISEFIQGVSSGAVADYQASAFLMAVYFQKMTSRETVALTQAMLKSGDHYDHSKIPGPKVDKHSTGGVGDKVSLILTPLAAACGLVVPMMAGRGLGHSGGTLDKLEAIPGFNVNLTQEAFQHFLRTTQCAIIGQTEKIVPADKKLYALRDVTSTVECIPLIVGSILSKKLAEGTESLVLDVKVGNGAFMKTKSQARQLAQALVKVARLMGLRCQAVLTNMDQPLGYAVGNAIELKESIEILKNISPQENLHSNDLRELTLDLCAQMLVLGKISKTHRAGYALAQKKLSDGSAWKTFQKMVKNQGGDLTLFEDPARIPLAPQKIELRAQKSGYLNQIETETVGKVLIELGGGRKKATDPVDPSVGLIFHKKRGEKIKKGDLLMTLFAPPQMKCDALEKTLFMALEISPQKKSVPPLIMERI